MGTMTKERQRNLKRMDGGLTMNEQTMSNKVNAGKSIREGNKWKSIETNKIYRPLKTQIIKAALLKDATYQRKINMAEVKNVMKDFRMELVNPIKVGLRKDGTYHIIDGQHTYMAIVELFGLDVDITCVLLDYTSEDWKHLSDEQIEARVFAHQHDNKRSLSTNEKFNAAVIGGEMYALNILKICENNQFNLCYKDGQVASTGKPVCTSTLIDIYNKDNGILLNKTLDILQTAYNGSAESVHQSFVRYIADFILKYEKHKNYSSSKFVSALIKRVVPSELISKAKLDSDHSPRIYGEKKTIKYCAEMLLLDAYNKYKEVDNKILLK